MPNILNLFDAMRQGVTQPLSERQVARSEAAGLTFSTILSSDMGYETAIGDANGFHPVERYATREGAIEGHAKWLALASSLTKITELGCGDLVGPERIELERSA